MLEKFLPRQEFSSYEDFKANYRVTVPERFNFAYDVVDEWARQDDQKLAIAWMDNAMRARFLTFADVSKMSNQAANLFRDHGIRKGDRVLLILKQRIEVWVCMVALHKIGAVVIPANFQFKRHDLVYRFTAAKVKTVVTVDLPEVLAEVLPAAEECPSVQEVLVVGDNVPQGLFDWRKEVARYSTEWMKPEGDDYPCLHDPMLLYFTSGTTGMPKMMIHDFTLPIGHIVTAKYWQCVEDNTLHMTAADSGWGKFAWGKIYGQWICGACSASYDYDGRFVARDMLEAISRFKLTSFCAPPTIYRFLVKEDLSQADFSSIRHCAIAGEPLNPEVYYQWLKQTGLELREGFGQTESNVLMANFPWLAVKPGSTGKFSPLFELDIVDDDGNSCEDGIVGRLVIHHAKSRRQPGLIWDYVDEPDAWTTDDYFTGDTVWRDEDGYIWFHGREDDVIKSSGYRIGPFEVESAIMQHPAVLECAVTAYPDPARGEAVKATVVLAKNGNWTPGPELTKEIQTVVKKVTAPYKYPRIVEYVDELPKTTSGKIRRKAIRQRDLEKWTAAQGGGAAGAAQ
jgi:acetyl-CoA synthetase